MSDNDTERQSRKTAKRVFARELADATHQFKESDDERAPNWTLFPTGIKANRVLAAGTLTEKEDVGNDNEYWKARIIDNSGAEFYAYAGQYQPDAASFIRRVDPPAYVSTVGKISTYTPDPDDDNPEPDTYVSLSPEEMTKVDQMTRTNWTIETANHTLARIQRFEDARESGDLSPLMQDAIAEYGGDLETYHQAAVDALEAIKETTSN